MKKKHLVHTPSIHGGALMGVGSFWPNYESLIRPLPFFSIQYRHDLNSPTSR